MMMMKTYLHFTPGDVVLFDTVIPSSAGAVFGTCLVFFVVAVFSRWLHAFRRGSEMRYKVRLVFQFRPNH
jgi:copper transporter 1